MRAQDVVRSTAISATAPGLTRVLLVEDDEGDALLVQELLAEAGAPVTATWVRSLREATPLLPDVDCVLLDLGLPDSVGLDGLTRMRRHAPRVAVVVLTGLADEHHGAEAVGAGAQDYLVKGQVDGALLARVIQYAVERRRSEEMRRQLREEQIYARENARLERGLLPSPLLDDPNLMVAARYLPGQQRMLLGGDFYDVVQSTDGTVHAVVGDVCGHGPDEAALGVCLRVAWRTMILAARPVDEIFGTLQRVFVHERYHHSLFATMCMLSVSPDRSTARVHLAGHPPPLLIAPDGVTELTAPACRPLGVLDEVDWPGRDVPLGESWSVLLYTDGLIEGRIGAGSERLGTDRLIELIRTHLGAERDGAHRTEALLDALVNRVRELNDGELDDDLAVLLLGFGAGGGRD